MKAFETLLGATARVQVRRGATCCEVVELHEGTSDACFAWRAVAKRSGFGGRAAVACHPLATALANREGGRL